jgi:hypothetical protein
MILGFFFVLILKLHFSSRLISLILKDKKESHKKKGERKVLINLIPITKK